MGLANGSALFWTNNGATRMKSEQKFSPWRRAHIPTFRIVLSLWDHGIHRPTVSSGKSHPGPHLICTVSNYKKTVSKTYCSRVHETNRPQTSQVVLLLNREGGPRNALARGCITSLVQIAIDSATNYRKAATPSTGL